MWKWHPDYAICCLVNVTPTPVILSIQGVAGFWLGRLILRVFMFLKEMLTFCSVDGLTDFVYISELLYFLWKSQHFGASTDSSFLTIFHFCHTSLLIFKILMLIFENVNISKDQWQKWAPACQPTSQPARGSQPATGQPVTASQSANQPGSQPATPSKTIRFLS